MGIPFVGDQKYNMIWNKLLLIVKQLIIGKLCSIHPQIIFSDISKVK